MTPKITSIDITSYLTERCLHFYRRVTQSVSNTVIRYEDAAQNKHADAQVVLRALLNEMNFAEETSCQQS